MIIGGKYQILLSESNNMNMCFALIFVVANEASEPYLLLNNGHQIYQYSLDGRRSHSLLSTLGVPLALTYNLR